MLRGKIQAHLTDRLTGPYGADAMMLSSFCTASGRVREDAGKPSVCKEG